MTVHSVHTQSTTQRALPTLAKASHRFGLIIILKKTEVMLQPKPGTNHVPPNITIDNVPLNVADKSTYQGSTLSDNAMIDDISARLGKASASFGRPTKHLWNERGVCLSTKIDMSCAVGCEAWTPYRRHIRRLDQFHMRCLRLLTKIFLVSATTYRHQMTRYGAKH